MLFRSPHVTNLNAYQSWPGFFAVAATWLVGSHASSWLGPAQWAPLFFGLLDVLALHAVFTALDTDRRVIWTGVWLFALGNWIGQDYFSPQAFAFFLYLVVILLVVRFLAHRSDRTALGTVLLCTAAIASSHPLTPFVLVVAVGLVGLTGGIVARRLPFAVAAVVGAWLVTGALGYMRVTLPSILGGITTLGGTVDQSLAKSAHASASQHLVALAGRGEVAVVALVACAGVARRARTGRWDRTALVLAVAPAAILAGGSYGGEAAFRVYFFALPFLAFLAAACCYPSRGRRGVAASVFMVAVSAVTLTGFLFGYFGKEEWSHFSLDEVRAAETVFGAAPAHSLVVDGTGDYPIGFANFENVTYLHIAAEPADSVARLLAAPEPVLYGWLSDTRYARGYLVITRSEEAESDALGLLPHGALGRIASALLASPRFTVLYHGPDADVFTVARLDAARTG